MPGVTALVTATAVLRLAADGRLGPDAPVRDYLRAVRLADGNVTVRELLSHAGGVGKRLPRPDRGEHRLPRGGKVTAPARLSTTDIPNGRAASRPVPSLATRAGDLLASEWTKFRSVRSTY